MTSASTPTDPAFDPDRLLATLNRHHVDYLLIGGYAARVYGATRPTADIDVIPNRSRGNLDRLAAAMRDLNARLRVVGDPTAESLHVPIDAIMLDRMQLSTWRTDAGDLDVLADIADRGGRRRGYDDLVAAATTLTVAGRPVLVAALDDIIASKQHANRPKDHDALPELETLRAELDNSIET